MCGILGSVNVFIEKHHLKLIKHRGPDDEGLEAIQLQSGHKVFFGHTRLSILGLTKASSQPMFTPDGNYAIIFNGEIYNHLDLRDKLQGVKFNDHSDTETILHYLAVKGIEGVKEFNGIFGFAFLDKRAGKLFVARDPYGVKPLYYSLLQNKVIFSSELKTILAAGKIDRSISMDALDTFLAFKFNPAPQTLFEHVQKVPAGYYMEISLGESTVSTSLVNYWNRKPVCNDGITFSQALEQYQGLLENAVRRQLLSDVPVGLLLSGGVDSAVMGYFQQRHSNYKIKTFTVGFEGTGDYNELPDARDSASFIGSEHYEVVVSLKEYMDFFEKSFYYTEEPIAEPTIPALYYVSKLASKHVKVVLSGQGADEPMAGYKRYYGERLLQRYGNIISKLPYRYLLKRFEKREAVTRFMQCLPYRNQEPERFMSIMTILSQEQRRKLYREDLKVRINESARELVMKHYEQVKDIKDVLNKLLYIDLRMMLADNLLLFNDKISMANSIENRVPFLDHDLVDFVESLPSRYKLRGSTGKYIQKMAVRKYLPDNIIHRKKRGFVTPAKKWLQEDKFHLLDYLYNQDSFTRSHFNTSYVDTLIKEHRSMEKDNSKLLFTLISLELFSRSFINQQAFTP